MNPLNRKTFSVVIPILLFHLLPFYYIATGTNAIDWLFFACLLPFQAIGVGVSMHRYFAHRSFKTSRAFQFFLALCAASTFGNSLGFAGKHRIHHAKADTPGDVHAPHQGLWACWFGSIANSGYSEAEILKKVPDFTRYPELMWLYNHPRFVGLSLCLIAFIIGGLSTVAIGVCLGVVIMISNSGLVNYCCHKFGSRRFDTSDLSTNNALVALLSFGEGWHNNHHHYPASARAGFYWWEIDVLYWIICIFETLGFVWDVRRPPERMTVEVASHS